MKKIVVWDEYDDMHIAYKVTSKKDIINIGFYEGLYTCEGETYEVWEGAEPDNFTKGCFYAFKKA